MAGKIPPLVTPFALVSLVLALGATNVVVNKTTHTNEGAKVSRVSSQRRVSLQRLVWQLLPSPQMLPSSQS